MPDSARGVMPTTLSLSKMTEGAPNGAPFLVSRPDRPPPMRIAMPLNRLEPIPPLDTTI